MKKYTTADIASELAISERTVRRWIADLVDVSKGRTLVSEDVFLLLKNRANADSLGTDADIEENDDFDHIEGFTTEEYIEFQKRINEYPVLREYIDSLKEQMEFLRFNSAQQNEVIRDLSAGIKQRNFIEAKEKGLDN